MKFIKKYKIHLLPVALFSVIFIAGWEFGLSPLRISFRELIEGRKTIVQKMMHSVGNQPGYITENQYEIDILKYDLEIELFPREKVLKGKCLITGLIKDKNIKSIDLNFYDNLKINYASLNSEEVGYIRSQYHISFSTPAALPDTFKVRIDYQGTPKRLGFASFVFGEVNGRSLIYNLSEPTYASTWFPCNDIPEDKFLLEIKITNDPDKVSVSNGILKTINNSGQRKTYEWYTVYPISTYLVALYSSDYVNFTDKYISLDKKDTMLIDYYVTPEHLEAGKVDFEEHPDMLRFFSQTFGEYPFIKEKYGVAEFLWLIGAMEHQTITGMSYNMISGNKFFNDTYVHELAHHWWGNAIGPKSWKDIWLNEGFASYSEALYSEHKAGKKALISTMLSKFDENFNGKLYNPDYLFSSLVYDKGSWVLHMLRWEVGDSVFFNILRKYFDNYKYSAADTKDFQRICESVTQKSMDKFFKQWVFDGEDIIKLDYSAKYITVNDSCSVELEFEQTQKGYEVYEFKLEIQFAFKNGEIEKRTVYISDRKQKVTFRFMEEPTEIIPDPDSWLLMKSKRIY
jgi:aminopeptidase N